MTNEKILQGSLINICFADTDERDLLLENEEILEGSSKQLDLGRRLLKETEDIGAGVLSDLSKLTIKELCCNSADKKIVYFFPFFLQRDR
jgi:hypothetical protein